MFTKSRTGQPYNPPAVADPRDIASGPSISLEGLTIGGEGAELNGVLSGTTTWTPGLITSGASVTKTLAVVGALVGNPVVVGVYPALPAGVIASGQVTAGDVVTVTLGNMSGGSVTLLAGNVRAVVMQFV